MNQFSGRIVSIKRVSIAASASQAATVFAGVTLAGADEAGRVVQFELTTDDAKLLGLVVRKGADGKTSSPEQMAVASTFTTKDGRAGKSRLLLHNPGVVTVSGMASEPIKAVPCRDGSVLLTCQLKAVGVEAPVLTFTPIAARVADPATLAILGDD
jgi:hypothetical protein